MFSFFILVTLSLFGRHSFGNEASEPWPPASWTKIDGCYQIMVRGTESGAQAMGFLSNDAQVMKLKFDNFAPKYDRTGSEWLNGVVRRMVRLAQPNLEPLGNLRVLDLGAGTGLVGAELVKTLPGAEITGVDNSEGMLERARLTSAYQQLLVGNLDQIYDREWPLSKTEAHSFHAIFSVGVLEFVADLGPVFQEVTRLLKPGGHFFFTLQTFGRMSPFMPPVRVYRSPNGQTNFTFGYSEADARQILEYGTSDRLTIQSIETGPGWTLDPNPETVVPIEGGREIVPRITIPYLFIHAVKSQ